LLGSQHPTLRDNDAELFDRSSHHLRFLADSDLLTIVESLRM
jgi:hypothetical protein